MAPKTTKKAIKDALADLTKEQFENFCDELRDRRDEPRVRRNQVEGKSVIAVADVLVQVFTEDRAAGVTVDLLKQIGCSQLAQKLVEETTGLSSNPSPGDGGRPSGVNVRVESVCTGADFVDKHRARLIDRVSNIKPILDELLDKEIVQQAAYGEIMNIPVTQDKMRRLYLGPLHAAGPNGKEIFFKALEEHEKWLVDDLKKNY